MIKSGKGRGDIDEHNNLKVLLPVGKLADDTMEGVFVKVIALHRNKKEGIGILENFPCGLTPLTWGCFVHFKETNPKECARITGKVDYVPAADTNWRLI